MSLLLLYIADRQVILQIFLKQKFNKGQKKDSLNDYKLLKVIGRGAFGKVFLVENKLTNNLFAMKSIRKEEIIEKDQIEHIKTERKILEYVIFY